MLHILMFDDVLFNHCPGVESAKFTFSMLQLWEAYVRVLVFSTSIYALQWIAECFWKAEGVNSGRVNHIGR